VQLAVNGRDPKSIKLLAGMPVIADETDELAQVKYEKYLEYADTKGNFALFGGWTGADLLKFGDGEDRTSGPLGREPFKA
jgi:alkanesulfonate monooxygenase SsuD/methylene tetrahydromethanopterin reductase-like flavin-dependent oxidoreductase (luciferase family)